MIKLKSPPSVGTRGDSRGATQVETGYPAVQDLQKIPAVMRQGNNQLHSFQVRSCVRLIPLLCNGSVPNWVTYYCSPVQLGGPFGFCAFASLAPIPLGSLKIALKRTRPRQRFIYMVGRYSMTERRMCQEDKTKQVQTYGYTISSFNHRSLNLSQVLVTLSKAHLHSRSHSRSARSRLELF